MQPKVENLLKKFSKTLTNTSNEGKDKPDLCVNKQALILDQSTKHKVSKQMEAIGKKYIAIKQKAAVSAPRLPF